MPKAKPTTNSVVEIKRYPSTLIHKHKSEDGDEYSSISFRWQNRWASLILPEGSVSQSVSRKGKNIEGRQDVLLGDPEEVRNVSVLQDDSTYQRTPMFNRTILSAITESRQEYLRSIAV